MLCLAGNGGQREDSGCITEFNDDNDNDVEDDAGFTDAFGADCEHAAEVDCEQIAETKDRNDAPAKQKRT